METLFYLWVMNETQTPNMNNSQTITTALGVTTITEMNVNKKGTELGWRQQFKAVTIYNEDASMPCTTRTEFFWKNGEYKHVFRVVQK